MGISASTKTEGSGDLGTSFKASRAVIPEKSAAEDAVRGGLSHETDVSTAHSLSCLSPSIYTSLLHCCTRH